MKDPTSFDELKSNISEVLSLVIGLLLSGVSIALGVIPMAWILLDAEYVTVTGGSVIVILALPLVLAVLNGRDIIKGELWRVLPWSFWTLIFIVAGIFIDWLLPINYPIYVRDTAELLL